MRHLITQFVLVLSLVCNPITGLAATTLDVFEKQNPVSGEMHCAEDMQQSQVAAHDTDGSQDDPMHECDCCNSGDCDIELSCQSCLNLPLNVMLLGTLELSYSIPLNRELDNASCLIPRRSILPEIPPPAPSSLS